MQKLAYFRTDGDKFIGYGHIMRCLALAHQLKTVGYQTVFCLKRFDAYLLNYIKTYGYEVITLPSVKKEQEETLFNELIDKTTPSLIITDSYLISNEQLLFFKKISRFVVSVDDLAKNFFPSNLVINQNIAVKKMYAQKTAKTTKLLLGPTYALLNSSFQKYHQDDKKIDEVKNILVTFGASDFKNQTSKVLKALEKIKKSFSISVLLGPANQLSEQVKNYVKNYHKPVKLYQHVNDIASLCYQADVAISAAGSTCWQLCCVGTPALLITVADNQKEIAQSLNKKGIAKSLGWYKKVSEEQIRTAVEALLDNQSERKVMSMKGKELVDGKGAQRVAEEIESLFTN